MKLYLDTNVFYNDWFMRQANLKYFFHFIANEYEELILSKVVCEEAENIRKRESEQSIAKIDEEIKKLKKVLPFEVGYDKEKASTFEYNFIPEIEERCENLTIIDYDQISHSEVVKRALVNKKPFTEGEKGYRDTLIWLSLLHHLKAEDYSGDVAFISQNTSDFFIKKKTEFRLHPDLVDDIESKGIKAKIIPYDSLFRFVQDNIDKDQHVVEHAKIEHILEREGCNYFSGISSKELSCALSNSRLSAIPMNNLLFSSAEIFEGLEDGYLEKSKLMKDDEVFVSYSFNIRRMVLLLEISKEDYELYRSNIEKEFYDAEIKINSVVVETIIRPYFDMSFIYNTKTEDYKDVSISCYRVR